MKTPDHPVDMDLDQLLQEGRTVRPLPDTMRERVLARARLVAQSPAFPLQRIHGSGTGIHPRTGLNARLAIGAAAALGIAGAAFAFGQGWRSRAPAPFPPATARSARPAAIETPKFDAPTALIPAEPSASPAVEPVNSVSRAPRTSTKQANHAAELELMRRAHSAYGQGNFGTALALVNEHARKFPGGLLAEEREALRVRSLAGAGRSTEARRAANGFAERFPRSVLLTRIQRFAAGGSEGR